MLKSFNIKSSYIVITLLVIIASVYFFSNSKGTLNRRASNFAIESIDDITKITIVDSDAELILEKNGEGWKVNGKYQVKDWNINNFLVATNRLDVLQPVSNAHKEQIASLLENDGLKVKFFKGKRIVRSYYVGKPGMNKTKTYMMIEKSSDPFVVRIPSFKGLVADLFVVNENYWRNKTVFDYMPQNVKSISVKYPSEANKSYKLTNYNDGTFTLQNLPSEEFVEDFKVDEVAKFFTKFQKISFEDVVSNLDSENADSIMNSTPFATITVEDFEKITNEIKIYRKPANGQLDEFGEVVTFDYNKAYGVLNNSNELILIQYYIFDPILKEIDYFR